MRCSENSTARAWRKNHYVKAPLCGGHMQMDCVGTALTAYCCWRTIPPQLGVLSMVCLRWIIVVCGIFLICTTSIAVRVDNPETAYNETEAPISLTVPVSVIRVDKTSLTVIEHLVTGFGRQRAYKDVGASIYPITAKRVLPGSRSPLNFLSTLIC
jgi:hypothetical protein